MQRQNQDEEDKDNIDKIEDNPNTSESPTSSKGEQHNSSPERQNSSTIEESNIKQLKKPKVEKL